MFGTIALLKPKAGNEAAVNAEFDRWWAERRPKVKGAIASTLYRNASNPAELMVAVVFESKETYEANANDPEQDTWFREKLVPLLESEPRWIDGDWIEGEAGWLKPKNGLPAGSYMAWVMVDAGDEQPVVQSGRIRVGDGGS